MEAVSRDEQRRWLARVDGLKDSLRMLVAEAREGGHDPVPEAVADMLDELRAELLEEFQASRRATLGKPIRAIPRHVRPIAMFAERTSLRLAPSLEWAAAGYRIRLRETRP